MRQAEKNYFKHRREYEPKEENVEMLSEESEIEDKENFDSNQAGCSSASISEKIKKETAGKKSASKKKKTSIRLKRSHKCFVAHCNKSFTTKAALSSHLRSHSGIKKFFKKLYLT
jgi:hypothetical protein